MPRIPEPENQWYVVHVLSGKEQQVHRRILRNLEAEEMGEFGIKFGIDVGRRS